MKKLIVLAGLSFISLSTIAQTQDSALVNKLKNTRENVKDIRLYMDDAGQEFKAYYRTHTTGTILGFGGLAVGLLGTALNETNNKGVTTISPVVYVGAGISLVGWFITSIVAPIHIKNAGIIFQNAGVSIPLNKKK